MSVKRWKFEVTENGQWVAGGDCPDEGAALREASHYVRMYGQDSGDVKALVWGGRKPRGHRSITERLPDNSEILSK